MLTRCRLCVRSIMHATVSKSHALIFFFHGLFRRLMHTVDMWAMIRKAFVQVFFTFFILTRWISCSDLFSRIVSSPYAHGRYVCNNQKSFRSDLLSLFILVRRISCLGAQAMRPGRRSFLLFPQLFSNYIFSISTPE